MWYNIYMIIYYIIYDTLIMYEMICNFIYDMTKEQYMIYNIQVWYTDMIYHMIWYIIYNIYNKVCDIWYMIIYRTINDISHMYEMTCNFIYDMINNDIWYTT